MVQVEVQEDPRHDGWVGEKRENIHLSAAAQAEKRKHTIDTSEEHGPADAHGIVPGPASSA